MKRSWLKVSLELTGVIGLVMGTVALPRQAGAYQVASTPTGIVATVIYGDPINVRSGPSTVYYPIIGQLFPGDVVPALGVSPGREWVQISYSGGQGGMGWVYASFVSVSGGELLVAEPPPTPAPLVTATIDPTFAAAFSLQPTQTRLPTFTPPSPLTVPQFADASAPRPSGIASGVFVISLGLIGLIGLLVSFVLHR